jgi:thymidylate synthase
MLALTPTPFGTLTDAYIAVLGQTYGHFENRTTGHDGDASESTNVSFRLLNPCDRTPYLRSPKTNIVFHHAEALWYLSGRDDTTVMDYYASGGASLDTDQKAAPANVNVPRLFAAEGPDRRSQFDRVIDLLRADPDTTRATMLVMRPGQVMDPDRTAGSNTIGLHLILRDNRLHMTVYLRSNDAVRALLCDTFSFTFIQEYAARQLGAAVGTYNHHVGSMYLKATDVDCVQAVLDEASAPPLPGPFPIDEMPPTGPADLRQLLLHESALRTNKAHLSALAAASLPLPGYWQRVLLLFEAYRQIRHTTGPVDDDVIASLPPANQWLLAVRWPERVRSIAAPVHAPPLPGRHCTEANELVRAFGKDYEDEEVTR